MWSFNIEPTLQTLSTYEASISSNIITTEQSSYEEITSNESASEEITSYESSVGAVIIDNDNISNQTTIDGILSRLHSYQVML